MSLLEVRDLHVSYGAVTGTSGVSFTLDAGRSLALVGSNGSGKSSTLRAIMGVAPVSGGDILLENQSIAGWKTSRVVRGGIALSPEGRRVFPQLTVVENLRLGGFTQPEKSIVERMETMMDYFPRLRERTKQLAGSLSGGEQQMLAIARALMARPRLLLLDEPSLGVAPIFVERIGEMLMEIRTKETLALVIAEQNAEWSMRLADHVVAMRLGRSVLSGASEELRNNNAIQEALLG